MTEIDWLAIVGCLAIAYGWLLCALLAKLWRVIRGERDGKRTDELSDLSNPLHAAEELQEASAEDQPAPASTARTHQENDAPGKNEPP